MSGEKVLCEWECVWPPCSSVQTYTSQTRKSSISQNHPIEGFTFHLLVLHAGSPEVIFPKKVALARMVWKFWDPQCESTLPRLIGSVYIIGGWFNSSISSFCIGCNAGEKMSVLDFPSSNIDSCCNFRIFQVVRQFENLDHPRNWGGTVLTKEELNMFWPKSESSFKYNL